MRGDTHEVDGSAMTSQASGAGVPPAVAGGLPHSASLGITSGCPVIRQGCGRFGGSQSASELRAQRLIYVDRSETIGSKEATRLAGSADARIAVVIMIRTPAR
jgi:hypothetical protein